MTFYRDLVAQKVGSEEKLRYGRAGFPQESGHYTGFLVRSFEPTRAR